jgi:hypothetical protein
MAHDTEFLKGYLRGNKYNHLINYEYTSEQIDEEISQTIAALDHLFKSDPRYPENLFSKHEYYIFFGQRIDSNSYFFIAFSILKVVIAPMIEYRKKLITNVSNWGYFLFARITLDRQFLTTREINLKFNEILYETNEDFLIELTNHLNKKSQRVLFPYSASTKSFIKERKNILSPKYLLRKMFEESHLLDYYYEDGVFELLEENIMNIYNLLVNAIEKRSFGDFYYETPDTIDVLGNSSGIIVKTVKDMDRIMNYHKLMDFKNSYDFSFYFQKDMDEFKRAHTQCKFSDEIDEF